MEKKQLNLGMIALGKVNTLEKRVKSLELTASELKVLEDKFWEECSERINKKFEELYEPILDKMLKIAREEIKKQIREETLPTTETK